MGAICASESETLGLPVGKLAWLENVKDKPAQNRSEGVATLQPRVLLLGPGGSGKSTVFKQAQWLFGEGVPESSIETTTEAIRYQIIEGMQHLLQASSVLMPKPVSVRVALAKKRVSESRVSAESLNTTLADDIGLLWSLQCTKEAFAQRIRWQIDDSLGYFLDQVDKVANPRFIPSRGDLLRTRVRTLGIVETSIHVGEKQMTLIDVGGQRSERRKWITYFQNVTCVLFVAALSDYNHTLEEADDVNRLLDSLWLFEEISSNPVLKHVPLVVFLNKTDLFREKLAKVSLSRLFPDFCGLSFDEACEFVRGKFVERGSIYPRPMYFHFTCALDSMQVQALLLAVRHIVLEHALKEVDLS